MGQGRPVETHNIHRLFGGCPLGIVLRQPKVHLGWCVEYPLYFLSCHWPSSPGNSNYAAITAIVAANIVLIAYIITSIMEDQESQDAAAKGKLQPSESKKARWNLNCLLMLDHACAHGAVKNEPLALCCHIHFVFPAHSPFIVVFRLHFILRTAYRASIVNGRICNIEYSKSKSMQGYNWKHNSCMDPGYIQIDTCGDGGEYVECVSKCRVLCISMRIEMRQQYWRRGSICRSMPTRKVVQNRQTHHTA